ncbi:MAG: LPS-assembly protein LptD [Nitrospirae bacterium]|nr:LPS-assembly protein LptD [Nitrospirota bacterium]
MEHFPEEDKYVAIGNVRIEKDGVIINADRAVLYKKTSDTELSGNVQYEDDDTFINTERADLNLDSKTGKLYNALIFFKKGNYWLNGENMRKIKEDHYYATVATFTTCDSDESSKPDWCFKGSDVDIVVGKKFTARDVTYQIKGVPVLYSPYAWAPVKTERETGFLFPMIGNSSQKGFQFSPAFFWAIDDNKDATFYLDYYTKRGVGKGLEYRYLDFDDRGKWYAYHLSDTKLKKDFVAFRGMHEHRIGDIEGFVDINYVNRKDFYREDFISKEDIRRRDSRIQRFLQSTGEISAPLPDGRLYLLGQQWIDLKEGHTAVPKRLPELGYVVNPTNIGPLMFTMNSSVTNFYRQSEPRGQRLDINPTVSYSFGETVPIFQSLSLRETAYNLEKAPSYKSSPHRETFEYRANALTRFMKKYESFSHIIEPSLSYTFIPKTYTPPTFDSIELFNRTSVAQLALHNSLSFKDFSLTAGIAQPLDFNAGDRPVSPTTLNASLSSSFGTVYNPKTGRAEPVNPFSLNFDTSYNSNTGRVDTVNSSFNVKVMEKTSLSFGERYSNADEKYYSNFGITSEITKKISVNANFWHDSKMGLRDASIGTVYSEQCWVLNLSLARKAGDHTRPAEYSFMVFVELKGIGQKIKLYQFQTESSPSAK